jgi:prepilin-type N-terminal cleavage/methylation domain-containing protein
MKRNPAAFTLVELLTVVAIIGLLAALIIPSLSAARAATNRATTRVRFNQWAAAIESFRAEYGCYPQFAASSLVNEGAGASPGSDHLFHDLLAGRHRDGSALAASALPTTAAGQNPKLISFYSFAEAELNPAGMLQDAFGDSEMVVLVDSDLDGLIKAGADFTALPAVHAPDGTAMVPTSADFPAVGLRAGVVFYSADPRAKAGNPLFIFSWK